jgi:predicted nuclease with TOPRIM domain
VDIAKELEEAKGKRAEMINRINQLDQERQNLLQEALRMDGEVRTLERLNTNTGGKKE